MDLQAFQERFGILGRAPSLRRAIEQVRQVAPTDIAVLFEGESGVGKEVFAGALHGLSRRRHRRIVVVNCGAIPEGLIEAELFGAEKGAYTGSVEKRAGYFEEADGGTLFLDEIGEMPLQAQVRLLRVLETGQYSRVGSSATQTSDARVVAATNKDLGAEVEAGRFREDLYYRLSTVVIGIPPLRARREDILPLFDHFVERSAQRYGAARKTLSSGARDLLTRYGWPGNVRELRNVAEQTVVLVREDPVPADALRPFLRGVSAGAGLVRRPDGPPDELRERELLYRALGEIRADLRDVRSMVGRLAGDEGAWGAPDRAASDRAGAWGAPPSGPRELPAHAPERRRTDERHRADTDYIEPEVAYEPPVPAPSEAADTHFEIEDAGAAAAGLGGLPETFEEALADGLPLPSIEDAERALIREALRRFDGNRRETAEALGISERTLYRKIKDIEDAE